MLKKKSNREPVALSRISHQLAINEHLSSTSRPPSTTGPATTLLNIELQQVSPTVKGKEKVVLLETESEQQPVPGHAPMALFMKSANVWLSSVVEYLEPKDTHALQLSCTAMSDRLTELSVFPFSLSLSEISLLSFCPTEAMSTSLISPSALTLIDFYSPSLTSPSFHALVWSSDESLSLSSPCSVVIFFSDSQVLSVQKHCPTSPQTYITAADVDVARCLLTARLFGRDHIYSTKWNLSLSPSFSPLVDFGKQDSWDAALVCRLYSEALALSSSPLLRATAFSDRERETEREQECISALVSFLDHTRNTVSRFREEGEKVLSLASLLSSSLLSGELSPQEAKEEFEAEVSVSQCYVGRYIWYTRTVKTFTEWVENPNQHGNDTIGLDCSLRTSIDETCDAFVQSSSSAFVVDARHEERASIEDANIRGEVVSLTLSQLHDYYKQMVSSCCEEWERECEKKEKEDEAVPEFWSFFGDHLSSVSASLSLLPSQHMTTTFLMHVVALTEQSYLFLLSQDDHPASLVSLLYSLLHKASLIADTIARACVHEWWVRCLVHFCRVGPLSLSEFYDLSQVSTFSFEDWA